MKKYAIIDKGNGVELLVGFKNKDERNDQELRFGYEFREGTFRPVDYDEARHEFGFRSSSEVNVPCELCGGMTFPACMRSEDAFVLLFGRYDHKERKGSWHL